MLIFTVSCNKLLYSLAHGTKRQQQDAGRPSTSKRHKTEHKHKKEDDKINKYGYTPLHLAVIRKRVPDTQSIFDKARADKAIQKIIEKRDHLGYPALHYLVLDESEPYSHNHLAILQLFLDNNLYDINAKDPDHLPVLYWCIEYKQPKLAKKILESDRVEMFTEFICKKLNEYYNAERLTESAREFYLKQLSCAAKKILNTCVWFVTNADQTDPEITETKNLLIEKYFGLGADHQPIKTALDILGLIKQTFESDPQNDPISTLQLGEFDEQTTFIAALKSGELDQTTDLILASGEFDKDIQLPAAPKQYESQKMLKGFIEKLYTNPS